MSEKEYVTIEDKSEVKDEQVTTEAEGNATQGDAEGKVAEEEPASEDGSDAKENDAVADAGGDGDAEADASAATDLLTEYQEQLERVLGHSASQPGDTGDGAGTDGAEDAEPAEDDDAPGADESTDAVADEPAVTDGDGADAEPSPQAVAPDDADEEPAPKPEPAATPRKSGAKHFPDGASTSVEETEEPSTKGFIKTSVAVAIAIACALGGGVAGYCASVASSPKASMAGKTALMEDELETVVGQVVLDGKVTDITARQVLLLNSSMGTTPSPDGSTDIELYSYPSADAVLATARYLVLENEAEKRGISVDDEAMSEFMVEMLGNDDYESVAAEFQIDVENLRTLVRSSYITQELRKSVVGDDEPQLVAPPTVPASDEDDVPTAEYFSYIIESAGDEWDAGKGAWKDPNGDFAVTLGSSKTFDPKAKTATYDDALGAYQVLGSRYSAAMASYDALWNEYFAKMLSGAQVTVYSLLSQS